MEPIARLYHCRLCHSQVLICSSCDHGQIYCSKRCSSAARIKSVKLAGSRYQKTFNGKCKHAARQARYRKKKNQIVTHHSSIHVMPCASMQEVKNNSNHSEKEHTKSIFTCKFCNVTVSEYVRNDFLHRISTRKIFHTQDNPQAP